jgi:hypothetical protein
MRLRWQAKFWALNYKSLYARNKLKLEHLSHLVIFTMVHCLQARLKPTLRVEFLVL